LQTLLLDQPLAMIAAPTKPQQMPAHSSLPQRMLTIMVCMEYQK
jgi:hypothetical protein